MLVPIMYQVPWNNAESKRHGGHFKEIYHKACELETPEN